MAGAFQSGDVWRDGESRTGVTGLQSDAARITSRHFEQRHSAVLRYLRCVSGNLADAEELTQETFLRLYVEIRDHHEPPNVQAWVFRVAHNLVIDHFRQNGDAQLLRDSDSITLEIADTTDSPEQQIVERERQQRVRQALAWLSPQQRQCLELRAEGLRYREISQILGIQISSVRTFIVRAVARIAGRTDV